MGCKKQTVWREWHRGEHTGGKMEEEWKRNGEGTEKGTLGRGAGDTGGTHTVRDTERGTQKVDTQVIF